MASIDFLSGTCQDGTTPAQETTAAVEFGLCDDVPKSPAYLDLHSPGKWIACVRNAKAYAVTFTSIDNCIEVRRANGEMESRCDGLLTYDDHLIFVELKEKNRSWLEEGIGQLAITIPLFFANHARESFVSQKAYLANSRHLLFQFSRTSRTQKFQDDTGVLLFVEAEIVLP